MTSLKSLIIVGKCPRAISCCSGRGEAPLSFRRAPRGLAMRRYRVGIHHATAVAQSYPGGFRPPVLAAGDGSKDALAATSLAAQLLSSPNRLRVKAPKSNHCACGAAGLNGSYAARDAATVYKGPPPPCTPRRPLTCPRHASS